MRFLALDALRGFAALAVLLFHLQGLYGPRLTPQASLAVDFFFMLSGFVLTHAYETQLRSGQLGLRRFMLIRLARLYPMYVLGLLLGAVAFVVGLPLGIIADPGRVLAAPSFILSGLFLPTPTPLPSGAFPLNGPAWSLSVEMVVNLAFAAFAARMSTRSLLSVAGVLTIVLALSAHFGGLGGDRFGSYFISGIPRGLWGFAIGMLLYRLHNTRRNRQFAFAWFAVVASGLIGVFMWPWGASDLLYLLSLGCVFPGVIWLGAALRVPDFAGRLFDWLGRLSYPLYITHAPLIGLAVVLYACLGLGGMPDALKASVGFVGIMSVAVGFTAFLDVRSRDWFRRKLVPPTTKLAI